MTNRTAMRHCSQHLERRLPLAFVAGFLGVLLFHQPMLAVLHALGLTALAPYPMMATVPLGVPRVLSLAFWGGVWAMPLALVLMCVRTRAGYWLTALVFGAIGPSVVNWLVVLPLKGAPMGGGWQPSGILTALIINGAWGLGTALLLRWAMGRSGRTEQPTGP
jgi:hypothetical protein